MLRIAIVDDEKSVVDFIFKLVSGYCEYKKLTYKIYTYFDGVELINSKVKFDIIFLDVEMRVMNGIETAQHIRKKDVNVSIVYMTSYTDYWRRAYKVHAFDFIVKPVDKNSIDLVMDDFLLTVYNQNTARVSFNSSKGLVLLNMNEIRYFYIRDKKKLEISTTLKGDFIIKENLGDVYEKLDKDQFYMPHRCCIVNLEFVKSVTSDRLIILDNGDYLPLSQRKKDEFMKKLSKNILKTMIRS